MPGPGVRNCPPISPQKTSNISSPVLMITIPQYKNHIFQSVVIKAMIKICYGTQYYIETALRIYFESRDPAWLFICTPPYIGIFPFLYAGIPINITWCTRDPNHCIDLDSNSGTLRRVYSVTMQYTLN